MLEPVFETSGDVVVFLHETKSLFFSLMLTVFSPRSLNKVTNRKLNPRPDTRHDRTS